jgi:hypothetical protein
LKDECCGFFTDLGVTLLIWNHGVPSIDELLRHFYALWMDSAETWQKIGEDIYVVYLATHGKRLDDMFWITCNNLDCTLQVSALEG